MSGLKRAWRELKNGRPGHRFQDRTEKSQRQRSKQSSVRRFLQPLLGLILIAAGIVLCVIPGPGLPVIALGAALLAAYSRQVARVMDWLEIKMRRIIGWAVGRFRGRASSRGAAR